MNWELREFIENELRCCWASLQGRRPFTQTAHGPRRAELRRLGLHYAYMRRLGGR